MTQNKPSYQAPSTMIDVTSGRILIPTNFQSPCNLGDRKKRNTSGSSFINRQSKPSWIVTSGVIELHLISIRCNSILPQVMYKQDVEGTLRMLD
ncbi:hypothetical protein NC653_033710 [Populus alba x Populus x berolinensis]|uniref:Uncharacterized protein n=1 Tax=Populus alba x Populus x berolinensis TaxID=444605 RepID=A0AAD6PZG6_9ROSI|nr:hypothetical protein NC653_033710 [Populus alba x Populus x berolinensis]